MWARSSARWQHAPALLRGGLPLHAYAPDLAGPVAAVARLRARSVLYPCFLHRRLGIRFSHYESQAEPGHGSSGAGSPDNDLDTSAACQPIHVPPGRILTPVERNVGPRPPLASEASGPDAARSEDEGLQSGHGTKPILSGPVGRLFGEAKTQSTLKQISDVLVAGRTTFNLNLPLVNFEKAIQTIRLSMSHGLSRDAIILEPSPYDVTPRTSEPRLTLDNHSREAKGMKFRLQMARRTNKMKERMQLRQKLPLMADSTQRDLLQAIERSDMVIILAKTGSGKTTQVPQIILDDRILSGDGPKTSVVCTQPRRIAASSVARRVADERLEELGRSVGFRVRYENHVPRLHGNITYVTTGILLNQLIADQDGTLDVYSHVIIDEIHERDVQIDLVLSILRRAMRRRKAAGRPCPKVILMSASIDPTSFLDYFSLPKNEGVSLSAECFEVEGSHALVDTHYLPEVLSEIQDRDDCREVFDKLLQGNSRHQSSKRYIENEMRFAAELRAQVECPTPQQDKVSKTHRNPFDAPPGVSYIDSSNTSYVGLAVAVIAHLVSSKPKGDILVFLPGITDMDHVEELLYSGFFDPLGLDFAQRERFRIFKLHSLLRDSNDNVFDDVPEGCQRIILATNIAETSVTLPEVVYVVDSGKERSALFDTATLLRSLPFVWTSKTSSIQRRGRAGRVRDGHYYPLFTKERHDSFDPMNRPGITVSDLASVTLQLLTSNESSNVGDFLRETIDPPSSEAINGAIVSLQSLGAVTDAGHITGLGRLLSRFGMHPAAAKGILLGALFGCLEPMLILGCQSDKAQLIANAEVTTDKLKQIRRQYRSEHESDFSATIGAFQEYHAAFRSNDYDLMESLRVTKCIRHQAYMDIIMGAAQVQDIFEDLQMLPKSMTGDTVFESLPPALNSNGDNMALVKALLVSTLSPELAAWRGREVNPLLGPPLPPAWVVGHRSHMGLMSRVSVNDPGRKTAMRVQRKHRPAGRLMAYTWQQANEDGRYLWLEQNSMVTGLTAILFSRRAQLEAAQVLKLNNWLRLKISAQDGHALIAERPAEILMELRKTLDRFVNLAWLDLERLSRTTRSTRSSTASGSVQPERNGSDAQQAQLLDPELRKVMVDAVVEMLSADHAHWTAFRAKRRAQIDAIVTAEEARDRELGQDPDINSDDEVQSVAESDPDEETREDDEAVEENDASDEDEEGDGEDDVATTIAGRPLEPTQERTMDEPDRPSKSQAWLKRVEREVRKIDRREEKKARRERMRQMRQARSSALDLHSNPPR